MKKLLLGVITFALIITSCNKYANDFAALKDQIAALDAKVSGTIALQTDLIATKAQVTALQTAVAGLPTTASITALATSLGTVNGKIDAITTTLNAVAASGTATTANVATLTAALNQVIADKLVADAALNTKLASLQASLALAATSTQVASLRTDMLAAIVASATTTDANVTAKIAAAKTDIAAAIAAGTTDVDAKIAALQALVVAANTANAAQISTLLASIQGSPTDTATSLTITGLQLALAAAQAEINIILASTAMYNGDVNLTVDAEVDFFFAKLNQLAIVNGALVVNPTLITAGKRANLATILSKIGAVIGTTPNVTITSTLAADVVALPILGSVKGNVTITSVSANTVTLPLLTTISGNYTVTGADVSDPVLSTVVGNVVWNYDGPYASSALTTVGGNLTLTNKAAAAPLVGTTSISLPAVAVTGGVFDGVGGAGVLVYPLATSIDLSGGVSNLTAATATSIRLGSTAYAAGLSITAPLATTVNLSSATSAAGGIALATPAATTINLSGLATAGVGVTMTGAAACNVELNVFNSNIPVSITGPITVSLPAWVGGDASGFNAPTATTVTLAKNEWGTVPSAGNLAAVKWLTLGSVNAPVALAPYTTLITASVTGKTVTTIPMPAGVGALSATAANAALTTVTVGGTLITLNLSDCAALTSLTTAGVVNTFILNNCDALVSATLAHTHYIGGTGSVVTVTNNLLLASLTTSTDMMASLTVTGNAALASANFASYVTKTVSGNPTITINTNKLAAAYTNAVAATITTPYVETTITSADLHSLKAYVALYTAPVLALNLDVVKIGAGAASDLATKMGADAAHTPAFVAPGTGITVKAELALVQ